MQSTDLFPTAQTNPFEKTGTPSPTKLLSWELRVEDPTSTRREIPFHTGYRSGKPGVDRVELLSRSLLEHKRTQSPAPPQLLQVETRDGQLPGRSLELVWEPRDASEGKSPHTKNEDAPAGAWWVRVHEDAPAARLGGISMREFEFPLELPVVIGHTTLTLRLVPKNEDERHPLPVFPTSARPWLTRSQAGRTLLWEARRLAETRLSVYITGETGTGKEIIAHLLHAWSPRKSGPFVPINCAALSLNLVESELFGHIKGAYTGADQARRGALLQANSGTLFLDEVGDLPMEVQIKLLRFLESGEIRPVGADHTLRSDVRILCATHKPLKRLVEEGKFRQDLYFRLASVTLSIPSLRSRPEDIKFLARTFAAEHGKRIDGSALAILQNTSWRGNTRELRHAVERTVAFASPLLQHLSARDFEWLREDIHLSDSPHLLINNPDGLGIPEGCVTLEDVERAMILRTLKLCHGNRSDTARRLGIARSTLGLRIQQLGIPGVHWKKTDPIRPNSRQLSALEGVE
jgi:DNA-binding NtrC family response regulator